MHPLAIFPQLFFLQLLAPLLLRVSIGLFLVYFGEKNRKINVWTSTISYIAGILLILGFYTQIGAILAIITVITEFYLKRNEPISIERKLLLILISVVSLSLMFTGPGFLALDLPL